MDPRRMDVLGVCGTGMESDGMDSISPIARESLSISLAFCKGNPDLRGGVRGITIRLADL